MILSQLKHSSIRFLAPASKSLTSPASEANFLKALARASGSFSGTRMPETPSTTTSGIPPTLLATTGSPSSMASMSTTPRPSVSPLLSTMAGSVKTLAVRYSSARASGESLPVKMIYADSGVVPAACFFSSSVRSPTPTMRISNWSLGRCLAASMR